MWVRIWQKLRHLKTLRLNDVRRFQKAGCGVLSVLSPPRAHVPAGNLCVWWGYTVRHRPG